MLAPLMARVLAFPVLALVVAACGSNGVQVAQDDPAYEGALIFERSCAMCHTLSTAGAQGSASEVNEREIKDGPNFNDRQESREDVLYAIRNGGFSSGPMPQNIVTGEEAEKVADFVAKYSGGGG